MYGKGLDLVLEIGELLELLLRLLLESADLLVFELDLLRELLLVGLKFLDCLAELLDLIVKLLLEIDVGLALCCAVFFIHGFDLEHVEVDLQVEALLFPVLQLLLHFVNTLSLLEIKSEQL